ncbi:MAG: hypothetical protein ACI9CV_001731 [Ilumatobacter sp.]|jgi:hypothetical protein
MAVPGETDLDKMLASLQVERRPGVFTFVEVAVPTSELLAAAHGMVNEAESTTLILPVQAAELAGLPVDIELAWLSLTVQSSLEAVGLTAAFAATLGTHDIPCNVLAGYHHDHILVPVDKAQLAIDALNAYSTPVEPRRPK